MDKTRIEGQKLDMHPARVAHWLAAKDEWETAKNIFPIYMEVSPVGVCNHECTFCSVDYMLDREDAPRLEYTVLERALTDMAQQGLLSAMFAGAGEPLLYKDKATGKTLADVIVHADTVGVDTAITTNAVLLTEKFAERAFQAKRLRWVRTSLNAGDRETYAAIHRTKPEDFDTVLRNLENAVKIRERIGARVQILAQIVVVPEAQGKRRRSLLQENYPSNIHTVLPLATRLRDIGVDNLAVKPYKQHLVEKDVSRSNMYATVAYDQISKMFDDVEALETDQFEITIRRETMAHEDSAERGYKACYSTPYHWAYIEADGELWACSAHVGRVEHGKELGDHRFRLGNVNELSFMDIWHGERRKACWEYTRKSPAEGGLDVDTCMRGCQMDMPNRYLWDLMNPEPTRSFIK
ncbi:hypothetical protein A3E39_01220 [Candidatus Uhrbacteria bacterium RIFCSPHIGHO2_12_FULL_60_25]|uniref:Radical SAM core domain-containing protein n=1 Tax=Candidatus Uhrbacteria bacterium RIFCSPHIGHO2_12_FULL_60_25 TaxID=1802399 RepID=A0A1F7ULY3_9BACT|nr:MAG: hypothetical protein A3D73_02265 [Candidatus Uhrbacteria bacterium RIFCSPHIGHO2_02_FULL_60_44]OGL78764.1 MAG: hypothetical protein A3E39_01220 [Candidatus Uhrbacteria bacterium RIFCSPHIGHO2_12_FULL_60_25]